MTPEEAARDKEHDLYVNKIGRDKAKEHYNSAMDACAEFRIKNPSFPRKFW